MKKILLLSASLLLLTAGCSESNYDNFVFPDQPANELKPIGNESVDNHYEGVAPVIDETTAVYTSDDGLCTINKKKHYYDVTLDLSSGHHYEAGAAYAQTILEACPDFEQKADLYVSDILYGDYPDIRTKKYTEIVTGKADVFLDILPDEYAEEIKGFASIFDTDKTISVYDGKLSFYEACVLQMTHGIFGQNSASAFSVSPKRSSTGNRLSAVLLSSDTISKGDLSDIHCVLRLTENEKSITSVTSLGMFDITAAANSDGVFAAYMPVKNYIMNNNESDYPCSFTVRKALESCNTARQAGESIIDETSVNDAEFSAFTADRNDVYSAEICIHNDERITSLRAENSELNEGLEWNSENCFCCVNKFVSDEMPDHISTYKSTMNSSLIYWMKYDTLFSGNETITPDRFKEILTSERMDSNIKRIRNDGMYCMLIIDHGTSQMQADLVLNGSPVDYPVFYDIGSF